MKDYLDLDRHFGLLTDYTPEELFASNALGKRLGWEQVLQGSFSVIIGRANFGKTTELKARAKAQRAQGKWSVFVALNKVLAQDDFSEALDVDDEQAYKAWQASSTGELTLFVDSLDEASLSREDGLRLALRRVARAVNWPDSSIRWVLSSRPAVLTPEVLAMLQEELRASLYLGEESEGESPAGASDEPPLSESDVLGDIGSVGADSTVVNRPAKQEYLKVYSLLPLGDHAAARYLSECLTVDDPKAMLDAARQYGLGGLCEGPGGLDILAYIDPASKPPSNLTEVFERMVEGVQQQQRADPRERRIEGLSPTSLDDGIQKLASASVVCQLPNIELSTDALRIRDGVLSARLIVASVLSENSLNYLLGSRLFIDSGHHQVKVYPDELLPYLAAKRLASLVKSPEHATRLLTNLTWSASTGECGVYSAYLPLAGWLATLSTHCRHELTKIEPQAVAFFGDLRNPNISLSEANAVLEGAIERLVDGGDSLGRRLFRLTAENYWQAGKEGIEPTLLALFEKHGGDFHARDALLDIASHAKLDVLREAVLRTHGGDYSKLIEQAIDLLYILSLGHDDDASGLSRAMLATPQLPELTVSRLLSGLGWRFLGARSIADVVARQFIAGRGGFHISWAITRDLAESADSHQLYALTRALLLRLVAKVKRKGPGVGFYGPAQNFVELLTELLAVVVKRGHSPACRVAKLCLVLNRFIDKNHYGNADSQDLRSALEQNTDVRRHLLRGLIHPTDRTQNGIYQAVFVNCRFCPAEEGDGNALGDPGLTQLLEEMKTWTTSAPRRPLARREREQELDQESKKRLQAIAAGIRDGSEEGALAWVGAWLSRTTQLARYGECNFSVFEREAGEELSAAVRSGLSILWRSKDPTWDEAQPNSTHYITVAGLQGLFLDLGDGASLPALSEEEVRRAIRYAQFEINGFPKWFWPVVRKNEGIALKEFDSILNSAGVGPVSADKAELLMRQLDDAPDGVKRGLARTVWDFIMKNPQVLEYTSESALKVAASEAGAIDRATFEAEAQSRMLAAYGEKLPVLDEAPPATDEATAKARQVLEAKGNEMRRQRSNAVVWGAFWLSHYPATFGQAWESWQAGDCRAAEEFMFDLAAHLGEDRHGRLNQLAASGSDGLNALMKLYEWVRSVVSEDEDQSHDDGQVYAVNARDHAQSLRNALIPAVAHARSEEAYSILELLRLKAPRHRAKYLRHVQFTLREEQAARMPVQQAHYAKFEADFAPPVSEHQSFAMAVHNDLLAIKSQIENGEFSLRRFFNGVNFKHIKSDSEGLALEEDFQMLLGSELNHACANRYTVSLEPILPNSTRRDVLCQVASYRATVELKMSERWTLNDYLESLEEQLKGQYMQAPNSKIGFFVVVLQRANRRWDGPGGKRIGFQDVLDILQQKARDLAIKDPTLYLRVIGIDATPRENFRIAKGPAKAKRKSVSP
ncbi:hypothetical protein [Burkholderia pseudomallei]|uniref:hypothetical protein n=1 Tax=Burkholderia pseudomallei TaxID=28450 RepID=UPI0007DB4306|nr:hypothetical protein [Burkholderia pseudomallei]ONB94511.1 hypothetical protein AQ906_08095 [Burkholderia pseudomallei]